MFVQTMKMICALAMAVKYSTVRNSKENSTKADTKFYIDTMRTVEPTLRK